MDADGVTEPAGAGVAGTPVSAGMLAGARRLTGTVGVNTPAEAAGAERPLGVGMLAEAADVVALGEPEAALVTSGSVLALVTWEVRVTSAAVTAAQGAGSFATEAVPGVEGRNSVPSVPIVSIPFPLGRRVGMQKTNRSGEA